MELRQHHAALGDVGGVVADPFQVAGDLQRRDDLPQVLCHWLAQRDQADDETARLPLERVHPGVGLDGAVGGGGILVHHRADGERHLALHQPAHFREDGVQAFQFLVVALDDMVGHSGFLVA